MSPTDLLRQALLLLLFVYFGVVFVVLINFTGEQKWESYKIWAQSIPLISQSITPFSINNKLFCKDVLGTSKLTVIRINQFLKVLSTVVFVVLRTWLTTQRIGNVAGWNGETRNLPAVCKWESCKRSWQYRGWHKYCGDLLENVKRKAIRSRLQGFLENSTSVHSGSTSLYQQFWMKETQSELRAMDALYNQGERRFLESKQPPWFATAVVNGKEVDIKNCRRAWSCRIGLCIICAKPWAPSRNWIKQGVLLAV